MTGREFLHMEVVDSIISKGFGPFVIEPDPSIGITNIASYNHGFRISAVRATFVEIPG